MGFTLSPSLSVSSLFPFHNVYLCIHTHRQSRDNINDRCENWCHSKCCNLIFMIIFSSNFLPFVHEDHLRSLSVVVVRLPSGILATFPVRTIEKLVFFWGFVGFLLIFLVFREFVWVSCSCYACFWDLFLVLFMFFLLLFFLFVCCIRTRTTSLPDSIRII